MNNKTACPQGHIYDDENTYHYRGSRFCRACLSTKLSKRRKKQRRKKKLISEFGVELGIKLFNEEN